MDPFSLLLILLLAGSALGRSNCPVSDYGADPLIAGAVQTAAVQRALDDCSSGGQVVFDRPGAYRLGSVLVRGTVDVIIPPGVILEASEERHDYGATQASWYLFRFEGCFNCSLRGGGTLDGRGRAWVVDGEGDARKRIRNFVDPSCAKADECRPRLLGIVDSATIAVEGVTLIDPIYWSLHVIGSRDVSLSGLSISSDWRIANTDGIDVDSSERVEVRGCRIDVADDAVCLKTTRPGAPTLDVLVADCELSSRSAALKIGSETRSDVSGVRAERLAVPRAHRGLAIQLRDGGNVSDVLFRDVRMDQIRLDAPSWWGGGEAVSVTALPRADGSPLGTVSDVRFERVLARSEEGVVIVGDPSRASVRGLSFVDSWVRLRRFTGRPGGPRDLRPGTRGIEGGPGSEAAVWVQDASDVDLSGLTIERVGDSRPEWALVAAAVGATPGLVARGCRAVGWEPADCFPGPVGPVPPCSAKAL